MCESAAHHQRRRCSTTGTPSASPATTSKDAEGSFTARFVSGAFSKGVASVHHNSHGQDIVAVAAALWFLFLSYRWSREGALLQNYMTFFGVLAVLYALPRPETAAVVVVTLFTQAGWSQVEMVTK